MLPVASRANRVQTIPMTIREVIVLRLYVVLLYPLQDRRRTADLGRIPLFPFTHSSRIFVLISPHLSSNPAICLIAYASFSTPSPSSPSEYPCLHPNCGHISSRAHDLKRHMTVHFPPPVEELLNCQYAWCGRTGAHGFKREDHRKEHYRKVHMKESEYPKTGKGGRSGRSGGSGGRSKS